MDAPMVVYVVKHEFPWLLLFSRSMSKQGKVRKQNITSAFLATFSVYVQNNSYLSYDENQIM